MKKILPLTFALLVLLSILQSINARPINTRLISHGGGSDDDATITCKPVHGFLPCTTNVWGILFQIVVYEIMLSFGSKYVTNGSNLLYRMIGPGIFGASVFQVLSQIPQILMVFVTTTSGTAEFAQRRATVGIGIVTGTAVMMLTLIWGLSVVVGSYDLSPAGNSNAATGFILKSYGVVTDGETSKTARIMVVSLIPFVIMEFSKLFISSSWRRAVILLALLADCTLLAGYMLYQIFQPSIQNRLFEHLVSKFSKDKLMKLVSTNGKPDNLKIQQLFNKLSRTDGESVSLTELRVLLFGVKLEIGNEVDDKNTEEDMDRIMAWFDSSGEGRINQDEFTKGIIRIISDISSTATTPATAATTTTTATTPLLQQPQNTTSSRKAANSWPNILQATFLLIFGTAILSFFSEPLINAVVDFSTTADISSFLMAYVLIPFVLNYGVVLQTLSSARQRTQKSISLTLSSLYNGVYMGNVTGLLGYLAPVFARNLTMDVSVQVAVVLIICGLMSGLACFRTRFPVWTGVAMVALYPISLGFLDLFS